MQAGFGSAWSRIMVREFFAWWFGQLADLLPQELRRSAFGAGDALVITPIGPLGQRRRSCRRWICAETARRRRSAILRLGAIGLADLPRMAGRTTVLRLGEADVLGKTVTLPLAAERELDQVLAFEMDRETPFKAEELYWNHRVIGGRPAKRAIVGAPLAGPESEPRPAAHRSRCKSEFGPGGWRLPTVRTRGLPAARRGWQPCASRLAPPALAGGRVLRGPRAGRRGNALCTPGAGPWRRSTREVAAGRAAAAEADSLRQEIDRLSGSAGFIESERDKAGRPLVVLAAATRVLPDDTYLTEMELRQRKADAERPLCRRRPIDRSARRRSASSEIPAFSAPVTRLEALRAELFTINAEVAP